jgi:hypothetical protein
MKHFKALITKLPNMKILRLKNVQIKSLILAVWAAEGSLNLNAALLQWVNCAYQRAYLFTFFTLSNLLLLIALFTPS